MTTCLHELLTLQISNCMTLHSLSWPRAAATTRCAALHEQDNIEIYVNRAEHVSAPNAESSALCRLTLGRSTTHQNCACPWIHGSAPSMSVWTCCSADLRLRRSVTVQIWEVIRRLSLHRTSGLQNPTDTCRASSCVSATPVQGMQVCEAMELSSSKLPELQGRAGLYLHVEQRWQQQQQYRNGSSSSSSSPIAVKLRRLQHRQFQQQAVSTAGSDQHTSRPTAWSMQQLWWRGRSTM